LALAVFAMAGPGFAGAFFASRLFFEAADIAFAASLAGAFTAALFAEVFLATFRAGAVATLIGATLPVAFVAVAFVAMVGAGFSAAFFCAYLFFVTVGAAFLPAAESLRFGLEGAGVASECSAGRFFAVTEDACTASFARVTAAFASRSSSRMWGALAEDRSATFDINASILAIRLRILFAFTTAPLRVISDMLHDSHNTLVLRRDTRLASPVHQKRDGKSDPLVRVRGH
jgi:hypothetical protein